MEGGWGAEKQPAAHQYHGKTHSCVWKCVSSASNEDVSPDEVHQHIPALLSMSDHICPRSSIYYLNPVLLPLSVFLSPTLYSWLLTVPTHMYPSPPPPPLPSHPHVSVFTQTSFPLFFSCSIPPSLFSPCSDPVQMASRCCCNSFAFTYISSTNTAMKTSEEMLTTHCTAGSGRLKNVLSSEDKHTQNYAENTQK